MAGAEYSRSMFGALRRLHWQLSLGIGFACLIAALWAGPAVMLVLFIAGLMLMFDGATVLWAQTTRTGGASEHRQ
jgi:hypothetical protein